MAALRRVATIRDDEWGSLFWACLFVFSLLAGNYLIRPVRDEMGIAGGTDYLPTLFVGTLIAMLVVGPLLSARLNRWPGRPSFVPVFRFFQLNLFAFFFVFQLMPAWEQTWAARAFFVWASITNLVVVSIAWGALAGRFTCDQAHRLFGLVAAGGTLGAIVGSSLAGVLAVAVGPRWLLLLAVGFLEMALLAGRHLIGRRPAATRPRLVRLDQTRRDSAANRRRRATWSVSGCGRFSSPRAQRLSISRKRGSSTPPSATRPRARAFFARIDLLVNASGLALQVGLTGRALAVLGAGGAAAMLPVVTLAGAIVLAMRPTVATVLWFQVARRSVDYAIARPSREVFYTVVDRAELSRAKLLIDTAVYRAGDAAGAWSFGLLAALPALAQAAPLAIIPLALVWIVLSLSLGRALRRRLADAGEPGAL